MAICMVCRNVVVCVSSVASPPSDVKAVQAGPTSILVYWSPSSDAIGYRIYYDSSGGDSGNVAISNGYTNEYILSGLQNGYTYTISIAATSEHFSSDNVIVTVDYGKLKYVCLCVHLSICLSVCLCLPVCLFICLFAHYPSLCLLSPVLQPDVVVSVSPTGSLYAGTNLTLTCTVTLDPYINNETVSIEWNGLQSIPQDRYSVTGASGGSGSNYTGTLIISPLTDQDDDGLYTCTGTVTGTSSLLRGNNSNSVTITVMGKHVYFTHL